MENQIVVFSDVHFCKNWDIIGRHLRQTHAPSPAYLNPNQELRNFIEFINASPEVEAVINNGDSIDYHYSDYSTALDLIKNKNGSNGNSNWDVFNRSIKQLNKKYFAVPGNHDYRKEAYNYGIWGTDHVNLCSKTRKMYKHKIGHHHFRGPLELASVLVDVKKLNPQKNGLKIGKRKDTKIGNFHCVFLDNGSDAFARVSNLLKCLKKMVRTRTVSYDPEGLGQKDIDYLSQVMAKNIQNDILIFQHAPLINSKTSRPGRAYQLSIPQFQKTGQKQGICYNTILNGGARLLKLLRGTAKNIILVSSHIHTAKYFLIDKISLKAREVMIREFNREKNNYRFIKHLTTLPLGGVYPKVGGNKTGFLRISSSGFQEAVVHQFPETALMSGPRPSKS